MPKHQFKSIKDKGGLKIHLNEPKQRQKHRGLGYPMYRLSRVAGLNKTARAQLFNVTFNTIREWDAVYDAEVAERDRAEREFEESLRD